MNTGSSYWRTSASIGRRGLGVTGVSTPFGPVHAVLEPPLFMMDPTRTASGRQRGFNRRLELRVCTARMAATVGFEPRTSHAREPWFRLKSDGSRRLG